MFKSIIINNGFNLGKMNVYLSASLSIYISCQFRENSGKYLTNLPFSFCKMLWLKRYYFLWLIKIL